MDDETAARSTISATDNNIGQVLTLINRRKTVMGMNCCSIKNVSRTVLKIMWTGGPIVLGVSVIMLKNDFLINFPLLL